MPKWITEQRCRFTAKGFQMPTFHVTGNQTGNTALDSLATPYTTPEIIDVSGITRMAPTFETGDGVTIKLAAHSEWIGGFRSDPTDPVKITGTGTFYNTGSSVDGIVTVGVNVTGAGTLSIFEDGPQNLGVSQIGGSVVVHADGSAYNGTLLAVHA
jgi:hypothetical protein